MGIFDGIKKWYYKRTDPREITRQFKECTIFRKQYVGLRDGGLQVPNLKKAKRLLEANQEKLEESKGQQALINPEELKNGLQRIGGYYRHEKVNLYYIETDLVNLTRDVCPSGLHVSGVLHDDKINMLKENIGEIIPKLQKELEGRIKHFERKRDEEVKKEKILLTRGRRSSPGDNYRFEGSRLKIEKRYQKLIDPHEKNLKRLEKIEQDFNVWKKNNEQKGVYQEISNDYIKPKLQDQYKSQQQQGKQQQGQQQNHSIMPPPTPNARQSRNQEKTR